MAIQKFTEKEVKILNGACPALHKTKIAEKVNELIDGASGGSQELELAGALSGDALSVDLGGKSIATICGQISVNTTTGGELSLKIDEQVIKTYEFAANATPYSVMYDTFKNGYRYSVHHYSVADDDVTLNDVFVQEIDLSDILNAVSEVNQITVECDEGIEFTGSLQVYTIKVN